MDTAENNGSPRATVMTDEDRIFEPWNKIITRLPYVYNKQPIPPHYH